jgi:putative flippase GtrA
MRRKTTLRRPSGRIVAGLPLWFALSLGGLTRTALADRFFDYNFNTNLEYNTNQRQSIDDPLRAYGVRASTSPTLGYETDTRAFSVTPVFSSSRFANDFDGDQDQFALNSAGRYSITERLEAELTTAFQLDNNLEVTAPDVNVFQEAIQRQSRNVTGGLSYRWSEVFSSRLNGTYLDTLFEEINATETQVSFDSKSLSLSNNYAWNDRLSFSLSGSLSRFKTFNGSNRTNDKSINAGFNYALSEKWSFSASGGLRFSDLFTRTPLPDDLVLGARITSIGNITQLPGGLLLIDNQLATFVNGGFFAVTRVARVEENTDFNIGKTYDLNVTRRSERGSIQARISRQLAPRSNQAQSDDQVRSISFSRQLGERLVLSGAWNETTSVFQGASQSADNSRVGTSYSANLRYSLTRQMGLTGGYVYNQAENNFLGLSQKTHAHIFTLGLSFDGDEIRW